MCFLYLFQGQNSLMRKMVLKKCLPFLFLFIKRILNLFLHYFFFLWNIFVLTATCLCSIQNIMFSALIPQLSKFCIITEMEKKEQWTIGAQIFPQVFNTLNHLTTFNTVSHLTCESSSKFLLAMSRATNSCTTAFSFLIVQLMFL